MYPQITAKQWAAYARRCARMPAHLGGLIGIQDRRGYMHAVVCYTVDRPFLDGTRIFRLHDLILAHLPGQTLGLALAACADQLATEFGCTGITVDLPAAANAAQGASTQAMLQLAGFNIAGVKLLRTPAIAGTCAGTSSRYLESTAYQPLVTGGQVSQPCSATAPG